MIFFLFVCLGLGGFFRYKSGIVQRSQNKQTLKDLTALLKINHLYFLKLIIYTLWLPMESDGEGNGNPLQYPCLENPLDRGTWSAIVHGFSDLDRTEAT